MRPDNPPAARTRTCATQSFIRDTCNERKMREGGRLISAAPAGGEPHHRGRQIINEATTSEDYRSRKAPLNNSSAEPRDSRSPVVRGSSIESRPSLSARARGEREVCERGRGRRRRGLRFWPARRLSLPRRIDSWVTCLRSSIPSPRRSSCDKSFRPALAFAPPRNRAARLRPREVTGK